MSNPQISSNGKFEYYLRTASVWSTKQINFTLDPLLPELLKNEFRKSFNWVEAYTQLDFTEITKQPWLTPSTINVQWGTKANNWLGWANYPFFNRANVFLNTKYAKDFNAGKFMSTIPHELGHALGLMHTHDYPGGVPKEFDYGYNSIMSYRRQFPNVGFQPWDLEVLRKSYGKKEVNTGNNVYKPKDFAQRMLVDDGGKDTLDLRDFSMSDALRIKTQVESNKTKIDLNSKASKWFTLSFDTIIEEFILPGQKPIPIVDPIKPDPVITPNEVTLDIPDKVFIGKTRIDNSRVLANYFADNGKFYDKSKDYTQIKFDGQIFDLTPDSSTNLGDTTYLDIKGTFIADSGGYDTLDVSDFNRKEINTLVNELRKGKDFINLGLESRSIKGVLDSDISFVAFQDSSQIEAIDTGTQVIEI